MRPTRTLILGLGGLVLAACPDNDTETTATTSTTGQSTGTTDSPTSGTTGASTGTTDASTGGATDTPTGGTTDGGDALADCQAQLAEIAKQKARDCACAVAKGAYPDVETCLQGSMMKDPACVCPILAADPGNAPYLECAAQAQMAFTDCITSVDCNDLAGEITCTDTFSASVLPCGSLTQTSSDQVDLQC